MKTCSRCKFSKPLVEFARKGNGLQSWCRSCNRERSRQYYRDNRHKHLPVIRATNKKHQERNRQFVQEWMQAHPCVDCGEADVVVLEFDHLRDKRYNISRLITQGYGLATLKTEIEKCDVVCANCHRRRTARTQGWAKAAID